MEPADRHKDFHDPAELLEEALVRTWQALCQGFDVTDAIPSMECLFEGVDFTHPDRAAQAILVNMLLEVMEGVGRFSSWYHMPARAYGLVSIQDPVSGCSHRLLAPEAVHKWAANPTASIAIQKNSGLIQAMLLVDGLMMQASLEDPCVFASCACSPARTIRLRQSILARGEILCDFCSRPFLLVEDFQRWVLEDLKRERRTSMMMHIKRPLTVRELIEARGVLPGPAGRLAGHDRVRRPAADGRAKRGGGHRGGRTRDGWHFHRADYARRSS
jgi:hypothetical protein